MNSANLIIIMLLIYVSVRSMLKPKDKVLKIVEYSQNIHFEKLVANLITASLTELKHFSPHSSVLLKNVFRNLFKIFLHGPTVVSLWKSFGRCLNLFRASNLLERKGVCVHSPFTRLPKKEKSRCRSTQDAQVLPT